MPFAHDAIENILSDACAKRVSRLIFGFDGILDLTILTDADLDALAVSVVAAGFVFNDWVVHVCVCLVCVY